MWMGKQLAAAKRQRQEEYADAEMGVMTMSGGEGAVQGRREERNLPVFGPGGVAWLPRQGEAVLVIKGGSGREERCVAGAELTKIPGDLQPGELYLFSAGGASVRLCNDGRIELWGEVYINGSKYAPALGG